MSGRCQAHDAAAPKVEDDRFAVNGYGSLIRTATFGGVGSFLRLEVPVERTRSPRFVRTVRSECLDHVLV